MPSPWIKIDYARLNPERVQDVDGVSVRTRLSPYDVPLAVRACPGPVAGDVIVEFRYLDDEPCRAEVLSNGVIIRLGKNSGRLFGIEVPHKLSAQHPGGVSALIAEILSDSAFSVLHSEAIDGNHRVAAEVIQTEPQLLAETK